jgi:hypothetical protein
MKKESIIKLLDEATELNRNKDLGEEETTELFVKTISNCRKSMIKTIMILGSLNATTPLEYMLIGQMELFEAMIDSSGETQIDMLDSMIKFLELIPVSSSTNEKHKKSRKLAIVSIKEFSSFAKKQLKG